MAKKLKITEYEKYKLQDVKYGEKNRKSWKIQKCPCRTWNMARKQKIMEKEKHPLDDWKNDEISENLEK